MDKTIRIVKGKFQGTVRQISRSDISLLAKLFRVEHVCCTSTHVRIRLIVLERSFDCMRRSSALKGAIAAASPVRLHHLPLYPGCVPCGISFALGFLIGSATTIIVIFVVVLRAE